MRFVAAALLVWAAIDGPAFVVDRAGVALLGAACAVLALPTARAIARRIAEPFAPAGVEGAATELDELLVGVRERIASATRGEAVSS